MDWLPGKRGDPFGVAFERVADGLSGFWIPEAYVAVVASSSEFALHRLPLDTKNPTFVTVRVCEGVSVNKSHRRALQSPDPVASRLPVGENDAQRIGDVWPTKMC